MSDKIIDETCYRLYLIGRNGHFLPPDQIADARGVASYTVGYVQSNQPSPNVSGELPSMKIYTMSALQDIIDKLFDLED